MTEPGSGTFGVGPEKGTRGKAPSALRPFVVRPMYVKGEGAPEGIMMPIRLA